MCLLRIHLWLDPLLKRGLNLNNHTLYILSLVLMFQDRIFDMNACEAKDV